MWLGSRVAVAVARPAAAALIRPLAWEPPYAMGAALEKAKRPKKKIIIITAYIYITIHT